MHCLVATPHRLGIREMAERVGQEWENLGHDVDYRLGKGAAARIGPFTVGVLGIARWWDRLLHELAKNPTAYDIIWTHQPIAPRIPTTDAEFWRRILITYHTTFRREYQLARSGVYPRRQAPYYWVTQTLECWFHRRINRLALRPEYTVVSPHLRDELKPYGVSIVTHIPNGVFTPTGQFERIRGTYDIPEDAILVLNVGSHTPQKRPVAFANYLSEACDEDTYCVMVGDGPLTDEVRRAAGDRVIVIGAVSEEEKWRWFAEADVFSSLSAYEGMPVATMEALSFGLPVILSDIPAHRSLFEDYDVPGSIVPDDPAAIHRSIKETYGIRASVSLPTWQDVAAGYIELMDV